MNAQELSPPAKARLRMNAHNLRHCARGALGGIVVAVVALLQQISLRSLWGKLTLPSSCKSIQLGELRVLAHNE